MALRFQKGDMIAVVLVVALAVLVAALFLPRSEQAPTQVQIYQDGALIAVLPLNRDGSFTVTGEYTNVVTVCNGSVCISASDCPGGDCVRSGASADAGRSIVCLPNGVEVRIVGKNGDVDAVVG